MPAEAPEPNQDKRPGFTALLTAIQFLLISPAFIRRPFTAIELGASVGYYPIAGLILGALLVFAHELFAFFLPPLLTAALTLAVWIFLTGALHLDGFLDSCDGLLGGFTPDSRLEIMRDERVGAYALAGGVLLLLIKFSSLASISMILPALLLAPVLSRWGMAVALVAFPYARSQGLGRDMKDHATIRQAIRATIFTLVIVVVLSLWYPIVPIAVSLAAAAIVSWLTARIALALIPGLTGDLYGAINEIVEVFVLMIWTISWR